MKNKQKVIKFPNKFSWDAKKSFLLMRDVIMPYHPNRKKDYCLWLKLLKNGSCIWNDLPECIQDPLAFDCRYLAEKTFLTLNKNLKESNGKHSDHVCMKTRKYSDIKSSSFSLKSTRKNHNLHQGTITGVRSPSGILKNGALRVMITDPFTMTTYYYYIPKKVWHTWKINGAKNRQGAIPFSYNSKTGIIAKLKLYRVETVKELANRNE